MLLLCTFFIYKFECTFNLDLFVVSTTEPPPITTVPAPPVFIGFSQVVYSANEVDTEITVQVSVLSGEIREPIFVQLSVVQLEYENAALGNVFLSYGSCILV